MIDEEVCSGTVIKITNPDRNSQQYHSEILQHRFKIFGCRRRASYYSAVDDFDNEIFLSREEFQIISPLELLAEVAE